MRQGILAKFSLHRQPTDAAFRQQRGSAAPQTVTVAGATFELVQSGDPWGGHGGQKLVQQTDAGPVGQGQPQPPQNAPENAPQDAPSGSGAAGGTAIRYPELLNNDAWQKSKSFFFKKLVGSTNIGARLEEIKAEFFRLGLNQEIYAGLDPIEFRKIFAKKHSEMKGYQTVLNMIAEAHSEAVRLQELLRADRFIPASDRKFVAHVDSQLLSLQSSVEALHTSVPAAFRDKLHKSPYVKDTLTKPAQLRAILDRLRANLGNTHTLDDVRQKFREGLPNEARNITTAAKWWDFLRKHMPELTKQVYEGSLHANFLRGTAIDNAASQKLVEQLSKDVANLEEIRAKEVMVPEEVKAQVQRRAKNLIEEAAADPRLNFREDKILGVKQGLARVLREQDVLISMAQERKTAAETALVENAMAQIGTELPQVAEIIKYYDTLVVYLQEYLRG